MLRSMTAYGRKGSETELGQMTWEMRSVNHRYLELSLKLPDELRTIEPAVREKISARLKRGKVDVFLKYQPPSSVEAGLSIDEKLALDVLKAAEQLKLNSNECGAIDPLRVLSWPGVATPPSRDNKQLETQALALLDDTLEDYIEAREREGEKTQVMLASRCDEIEKIVMAVRELRPAVVERLNNKLLAKLEQLDVEVEAGRLEQELVFAAQKLDVDEELDRLGAHVSEMRKIFERNEPVGRRLDFLIQEFNREANTLGSKSADSDTTGFSVELKVLIEQMREQVQNLE